MTQRRRRKCLNCGQLFHPDPRNKRHQRHCSEPPCRKASKAASQRRWLDKPTGRDYFRGPAHVQRVRDWRVAHPQYWKRPSALETRALQDPSSGDPPENRAASPALRPPALQDLSSGKPLENQPDGPTLAPPALQGLSPGEPVQNQPASPALPPLAPQGLSSGKPFENQSDSPILALPALQELFHAQPYVLAGLIAQLTGDTLQDAMPHAA